MCALTCLSTHHGCKEWLAFLSAPRTSLTSSTFSPTELLFTGCYIFFTPFRVFFSYSDCYKCKSQMIISFRNTQTSLSGTSSHATVSHSDHVFSHLKLLSCIWMSLYVVLLSHDWLRNAKLTRHPYTSRR